MSPAKKRRHGWKIKKEERQKYDRSRSSKPTQPNFVYIFDLHIGMIFFLYRWFGKPAAGIAAMLRAGKFTIAKLIKNMVPSKLNRQNL